MESRGIGLLLVGLGVLMIIVGLLAYSGALGWFGRLPGDIRIVRGSTRVYFPIISMLALSVILSLLFALLRRIR